MNKKKDVRLEQLQFKEAVIAWTNLIPLNTTLMFVQSYSFRQRQAESLINQFFSKRLVPSPFFAVPQFYYGTEAERGGLGSDLEFAGFGHVFDAFERFVLLAIHIQPVYLQTCWVRKQNTSMSLFA